MTMNNYDGPLKRAKKKWLRTGQRASPDAQNVAAAIVKSW